jgi:hypothetical protein
LFRHKVFTFLKNQGLLSDERIELLLSWKNTGFSIDNSVTVYPSDHKESTLVPKSKLCRRWADLIGRVYQSDPLVCPKCGSQMRILSFITQDRVIRKILEHLKTAPPKHADHLPMGSNQS